MKEIATSSKFISNKVGNARLTLLNEDMKDVFLRGKHKRCVTYYPSKPLQYVTSCFYSRIERGRKLEQI
jgi:hypothetical protein